jgi:outer membrane protein assembly factor BamB
VNPSYTEACNGIDDDCDGQVDEVGADGCSPYYIDADGDGYGVQGTGTCLCEGKGQQTALLDGDCADGDPARSPLATDTCNAIDDDCDGGVDEGCPLAETGWPTYKYDARRTGHRQDVEGPTGTSSGWTYPLAPGSGLHNSVALVPDGIIAHGGKTLVKLSFAGDVVWSHTLPVGVSSRNSPTVREGGTILVPVGGELRLYGPDGGLLWTSAFAGESITAAPVVADDGAIYVLSTAGLRKLDAAGKVVWTSPAPNTQTSPGHPAVAPNGRIHFATSNNSVYSVTPDTGLAAWVYTQPQGYDTDSSVAIAPNGDVYQGFGNTIVRLAPDGAVLGTVGVAGDMDGDVALLWDEAAGDVFVYASPNSGSGLRRHTSALVHQWTYPLTKDGSQNGVPVFDGRGDAYVGDDTGIFVCVKKDGTLRWSLASGAAAVKSAAAVGPGFVVFGDGAGTLHFVGGAP